MRLSDNIYKKNNSSDKLSRQLWRAIAEHWFLSLLFVFLSVLCLITLLAHFYPCCCFCQRWNEVTAAPINKGLALISITFFLVFFIRICDVLTDINSLQRNENRITWCQIWILISIGLWLISVILILGIQKSSRSEIVIGLIASVLAWIFQEKIRGAVAFIHLRMHHLLNIDDWIMVPQLDVDGEVKKVTLTTVTLSNWDTTTSTIPISALHSGHFINLQNMAAGRTYGRKMQKTFTIDTSWVHAITEEEANRLKSGNKDITSYLPNEEIVSGALNAHLYRLYLYHWLMNNPVISHQPRLIVRWMDQKDSGMTLQVYAFIMDGNFSSFEWHQSQIIEHIVTSLEWFGLKLFQSPSAYDVSNSNIHIENPELFKKEEQ